MTENDIDPNIHKTQPACYLVGASLVLYLFASIIIMLFIRADSIDLLKDDILLRAHIMCGAFGMLGATMAAIRKYYKSLITEISNRAIGNQDKLLSWEWGWVFYYVTRPVLGAVLGVLTYTLSFVGFQIVAPIESLDFSAQGHYLIYGISLLAGYSVSHVLDRMELLAKQIFKSSVESEKGD